MRVVIVGAGGLAATAARVLLQQGCEVILIERDPARIESLTSELDCGFVNGDGTKPAILREVGPERTDVLLCLTGSDKDNILASLVGRHLGYPRVVTKIEDPEFEHVCVELGLEDTIIPDRAIARSLADLVAGRNVPELLALIRGEVRFFSFKLRDEGVKRISDLELPKATRLIGVSRADAFLLPAEDDALEPGDEVVLISATKNLPALRERWTQRPDS
jgi:trk system potassium uptake protein TrkA